MMIVDMTRISLYNCTYMYLYECMFFTRPFIVTLNFVDYFMISKTILATIANIFLYISLKYVFGAQKNRLPETVLLSTYNIYFG